MPQMAPLMWTPLFILFTALLILSATKIYFSSSPNYTNKIATEMKIQTQKKLMWKW